MAPLTIGLTGGIAAGKSEALKACARLGAATLASDAVVHERLESEQLRRLLVERWGPDVVKDGKAAQVMVQVGPEVKGKSVIYKGLQPGDQVMVEGFQKVRPGAPVQPKPWTQPKPQGAAAAAAPAGADKAPAAAGDKPAATQSSAKG